MPVQVDGEPWIQTPGEVVVSKSALKVRTVIAYRPSAPSSGAPVRAATNRTLFAAGHHVKKNQNETTKHRAGTDLVRKVDRTELDSDAGEIVDH